MLRSRKTIIPSVQYTCGAVTSVEGAYIEESMVCLRRQLGRENERSGRLRTAFRRVAGMLAHERRGRVSYNRWGLALLERLGDFLRAVIDHQAPMTCQIIATLPGAQEPMTAIHVWATIDDSTPVARLGQLAAERDSYRTRMELAERYHDEAEAQIKAGTPIVQAAMRQQAAEDALTPDLGWTEELFRAWEDATDATEAAVCALTPEQRQEWGGEA